MCPTHSCTVALGLALGSFGETKVAGSWLFTTQQSVRMECDGPECMQQLCAPLGLGCRQIPSGAIIIPIRRMAIAARWKEARNIE